MTEQLMLVYGIGAAIWVGGYYAAVTSPRGQQRLREHPPAIWALRFWPFIPVFVSAMRAYTQFLKWQTRRIEADTERIKARIAALKKH